MSSNDHSSETAPDIDRDANGNPVTRNSVACNSLRPDSPCAGYCSTSHGDEVCKGCGRTWDEVLNWIIYTDEEKDAVWARLEAAGLLKVKR